MLGCVVGGAGTGLWVKFDFGSARSTVVRDRPDLGYRPGDRRISRPAKPKEADSEEEATDSHRGETCFGNRFSVCRGGNACVTGLVGEVNDDGGEDADEEGDKWEG